MHFLDHRLGQKSCRTKVPRIFRIFVPNFAPNFAPDFSRIFPGVIVLHFVGDGDQKKFTKNPRHFSTQNPQANSKKKSTKVFWRAGKVTLLLKKVLQYTSNSYCNTPPICTAICLQFYCSAFGAIGLSGKGNTSILLPFVSQYASHLYFNTPPIGIAILLGKTLVVVVTGMFPSSGPLNGLNAKLSLLHPLNRYRNPLCDRKCDWEGLSRPTSHPHAGRSSQPPHSKPLTRLNRAIVVL